MNKTILSPKVQDVILDAIKLLRELDRLKERRILPPELRIAPAEALRASLDAILDDPGTVMAVLGVPARPGAFSAGASPSLRLSVTAVG